MNVKTLIIFFLGFFQLENTLGQFEHSITSQADSVYKKNKVKSRQIFRPNANYSFKYDYDTLGRIQIYTRFYRGNVARIAEFNYEFNSRLISIETKSFIRFKNKDEIYFVTNPDSAYETKEIYDYDSVGRKSSVSYLNQRDSVTEREKYLYIDNSVIKIHYWKNHIDTLITYADRNSNVEKFINKKCAECSRTNKLNYDSNGLLKTVISTPMQHGKREGSLLEEIININYNSAGLIENCTFTRKNKNGSVTEVISNKFNFYP